MVLTNFLIGVRMIKILQMTNLSVHISKVLAIGATESSVEIIKKITSGFEGDLIIKKGFDDIFFLNNTASHQIDCLIIAACTDTPNRLDYIDNIIRFFISLPAITILEHKLSAMNQINVQHATESVFKMNDFAYETRLVFPSNNNFLINDMNRVSELIKQINNFNSNQVFGLTKREKELVMLLADGQSYKSCAVAMNISLSTVQAHIRNLYTKLNVRNNRDAVKKALGN